MNLYFPEVPNENNEKVSRNRQATTAAGVYRLRNWRAKLLRVLMWPAGVCLYWRDKVR